MERKCGTTRVAYVGEKWTLKRPLLHLGMMQSGSLAPIPNMLRGRWKRVRWFFTKGADAEESLLWCLGQEGWRENCREIRSCDMVIHLVYPTRALVASLLVCQRTTKDIPLTIGDMWGLIQKTSLEKSEILLSSSVAHTLENPDNYGASNNFHDVRLRDYGGEGVSEFLIKNRAGITQLLGNLVSELK